MKFMFRSMLFVLLAFNANAESGASNSSAFLHESQIVWKMNEFPIHRWKTLVGGGAGGRMDPRDILFGIWELAPKAIYHGHKHAAPEIYYIVSGKALWTVGEETREVTSGSAIYTRPGAVHKMVNLLDRPLRAVWVWWAPDGERSVFGGEYLFTEDPPVQPENR